MQDETVLETRLKEDEPVQQQSVLQEPNVAETKVPAEGHAATKLEIPLRSSQSEILAPIHLKDYYT